MASCPYFVYSKNLEDSLPGLQPHPAPFSFCRKLQQANIDELYDMRHKEVTIESKCIPNPIEKYDVDLEMMVPVSIKEREEIDVYNIESRQHMQRLLDEDKRLVCEWIVIIDGIHRIFAARIIKMGISLFAFHVQVAVIFLPENAQKYLFLLAAIILTPLALVEALGSLVLFGGSMLRITDAELERELYYIRVFLKPLFCCFSTVFSWICSCCCYCRTSKTKASTKTDDINTVDENEYKIEMEMVALDKLDKLDKLDIDTLESKYNYPSDDKYSSGGEITMHSSNPMHDISHSDSDSNSKLASLRASKSGVGNENKDKNRNKSVTSLGVGGGAEEDPDVLINNNDSDTDTDEDGQMTRTMTMTPVVLGILNSEKEKNSIDPFGDLTGSRQSKSQIKGNNRVSSAMANPPSVPPPPPPIKIKIKTEVEL